MTYLNLQGRQGSALLIWLPVILMTNWRTKLGSDHNTRLWKLWSDPNFPVASSDCRTAGGCACKQTTTPSWPRTRWPRPWPRSSRGRTRNARR